MSATMLKTFGFLIGIASGILFFVILGTFKGETFFGLGALSVMVGLIVGGAMQKFLVNRFMPEGENL